MLFYLIIISMLFAGSMVGYGTNVFGELSSMLFVAYIKGIILPLLLAFIILLGVLLIMEALATLTLLADFFISSFDLFDGFPAFALPLYVLQRIITFPFYK